MGKCLPTKVRHGLCLLLALLGVSGVDCLMPVPRSILQRTAHSHPSTRHRGISTSCQSHPDLGKHHANQRVVRHSQLRMVSGRRDSGRNGIVPLKGAFKQGQAWITQLLFSDNGPSSDPPCSLVTGGNRGIGLAIAQRVGELGHKVILTCRNREAGLEAEALLRKGGIDVTFQQLDVTNSSAVNEVFERCAAARGDLRMPNFLFNNAGVCLEGDSLDVLRATLEVNYWGAVTMTEAMFSHAGSDANQPPRTVINLSSGEGELTYLCSELKDRLSACQSLHDLHNVVHALADAAVLSGVELAFGPTPAYSVSKALLNAFTRLCFAPSPQGALPAAIDAGDRIISVCPGDVDTRMSSEWQDDLQLIPPREAAADIVWAALHDEQCCSGRFYRARAQIPW